MAMDKLLELMAEKRPSDLFITVGSPIQLKLNGVTVPVNQTRLEQQQVEAAFWTGTAGGQEVTFPHLAADAEVVDAQDIVLQTAATPVVTARG